MPKYIAHKEEGYCIRIGNRSCSSYFMVADGSTIQCMLIQVFEKYSDAKKVFLTLSKETQKYSAVVPVEVITKVKK